MSLPPETPKGCAGPEVGTRWTCQSAHGASGTPQTCDSTPRPRTPSGGGTCPAQRSEGTGTYPAARCVRPPTRCPRLLNGRHPVLWVCRALQCVRHHIGFALGNHSKVQDSSVQRADCQQVRVVAHVVLRGAHGDVHGAVRAEDAEAALQPEPTRQISTPGCRDNVFGCSCACALLSAKLQSWKMLPTWQTASAPDATSLPTKLGPDPVRSTLKSLSTRKRRVHDNGPRNDRTGSADRLRRSAGRLPRNRSHWWRAITVRGCLVPGRTQNGSQAHGGATGACSVDPCRLSV